MSPVDEMLLGEFVPRPISSQRGYRRKWKLIDGLIRKVRRSRAADDLLEPLVSIVEPCEIRQGYTMGELSPLHRLAGLIEARGLLRTELAPASPVPRTTINKIVTGCCSISKANVLRLADDYGRRREEFIAEDFIADEAH